MDKNGLSEECVEIIYDELKKEKYFTLIEYVLVRSKDRYVKEYYSKSFNQLCISYSVCMLGFVETLIKSSPLFDKYTYKEISNTTIEIICKNLQKN